MDINHLAKLSGMTLTTKEGKKLAKQFHHTLDTISLLNKLNTKQIKSTFQVTGLTNVFRPDKHDRSRSLTQAQALSNANKTYKGYIVVPGIFDET
jgi:aspartyl/glutamyl-tRNA(Asn/Gln) amidotransferase C subunit